MAPNRMSIRIERAEAAYVSRWAPSENRATCQSATRLRVEATAIAIGTLLPNGSAFSGVRRYAAAAENASDSAILP
jgi:hypothetical protein